MIKSGIRSAQSNKDLGSKLNVKSFKNSYHIPRKVVDPLNTKRMLDVFNCCDFFVQEANLIKCLYWAMDVDLFRQGGIGFYPAEGIIHVDGRPDGQSRWARVKGEYVSMELGLSAYMSMRRA